MNNTPTKNATNDNAAMKANRYAKAAAGRARFAKFVGLLNTGGTVVFTTAIRATKLDRRHVDALKIDAAGSIYLRRGKNWDCVDFTAARGYAAAR